MNTMITDYIFHTNRLTTRVVATFATFAARLTEPGTGLFVSETGVRKPSKTVNRDSKPAVFWFFTLRQKKVS